MKQYIHRTTTLSVLALFTAALAGCGGGGGSSASASFKSSATVLVSGNSNATSPRAVGVLVPEDLSRMSTRGEVDPDDIESLWVTITEITLDRVGNPDPEGEGEETGGDAVVEVSNNAFTPDDVEVTVGDTVTWEWVEDGLHTVTSGVRGDADAGELFDATGELEGDFFVHTFQTSGDISYFSDLDFDAATGMVGVVRVQPDNSQAPPKITVFRGALRVNLKDLDAVSEILSMAAIPAGQYTGIRLKIQDPELVLVGGDPNDPITDIHLTANNRLFIKEKFEVAEGENILVIIDFGDIHLVQLGNGGYVLTPQLRVILDLIAADVEIQGIITEVDADAKTILVLTASGDEVLVDVSDVTEVTNSNGDTLAFEDLAVDQTVYVQGTLNVDNTIDATVVEIQVEEEEA